MRRAIILTAGTAVVAAVAASLAREAKHLEPAGARTLLLGLCVFLVFEWFAHFLGSRPLWGLRRVRIERAAWAAISSASIWISLLAAVPSALALMGVNPTGPAGLALMALAAGGALALRLWFLREIYELDFDRAATLWALTRGTAALIAFGAAALYALSGAVGRMALPALSISP